MRLHVVKAAEGDGLLLESGDALPHRVLIDGGSRGCWESDMRPHLEKVLGKAGRVDALLVSHVDNDHIIAPLDMLADRERDRANGKPGWPAIGDLWHNSFEQTLDTAGGPISKQVGAVMARAETAGLTSASVSWAFYGIKEGARLRRDALREGIGLNAAFGGGLISPDRLANPSVTLGGMSLTVIGPTTANLGALKTKWDAWAKEAARKQLPGDLANIDKSVPNLSSIVILAEEGGRRILLTGDARGDHIEQGLDQAKLRTNGRIHVDVLKLQHHGSARNVERRFFDAVTADTYVVSANGRYDNPDLSTLTWIVEAAREQGRTITLVATYVTPSLTSLMASHPPAPDWYSVRLPGDGDHAVTIEV
jgi:hypothetical protein